MFGLLCLALAAADAPRVEPPVSLRPEAASEAQLLVDVRALERSRPGSGPGVALMVLGGLGTLVSGGAFFGGTDDALRYGSVGAVASVGLFLAGIWWLVVSGTERTLIDLELYSLRKALTNLRTARRQRERVPSPQVLGP